MSRMARVSIAELREYLLRRIIRSDCGRVVKVRSVSRAPFSPSPSRFSSSTPSSTPPPAPPPSFIPDPTINLRKQPKDHAKAVRASSAHKTRKKNADNQTVPGWELTVGIEIHARLNTARKLFSPAVATSSAAPDAEPADPLSPGDEQPPNAHVALFDAALPGSQPVFQPATLIPAVRAALALNCEVSPLSRFDRKHYFHWDQPSGYQITQFYEPLARKGHVLLHPRDGIADEEGAGRPFVVGIRQVQMEQDTAKTTLMPGDRGKCLVDLNRVGAPLIEIITDPVIHYPATAAALVRKVQMLLDAVDACVIGMEAGGLRADVNVSVRSADAGPDSPLGQRTEIKNLSSFKAVEDAIIAERDRQIALLEKGGIVESETRGWTLGGTETRLLRKKEGEVDYRYLPDPDLGPVVVGDDLVAYLGLSMGLLPDAEVEQLIGEHGLSSKDAMSLMQLDNGGRVQYFYDVLHELEALLAHSKPVEASQSPPLLVANWCLHEIDKVSDMSGNLAIAADGACERLPPADLAAILAHICLRRITARVAKDLLWAAFRGETAAVGGVTAFIDAEDWWFRELDDGEYVKFADEAVHGEDKVLREFVKFTEGKAKAYPQGKLMFLVGKMMRLGPDQRMDPASAARVMAARLADVYVPAAQEENVL